AEAEADAADDAGAEPHQPELMHVDTERADDEAAAPAQRRDDAGLARSHPLEPATPDRGGRAQEDEEQREHPAEIADLPIAGRREQAPEQADIGRTRDRLVDPE